jgi:hypothetical protein
MEAHHADMLNRAANIDAVVDEFKGYCLGPRIKNMFANNGIIRGKWGLGSTAWAPNTAWVATAKGRNKPLHGAQDGKSIKSAYKFNRRMSGRGKLVAGAKGLREVTVTLSLDNEAPQTKYLERGIGYGRRIFPHKKGGMLAVPIAPGVVAFLPSVRFGARKARHITGFFQGDLKWIVNYALKRALNVSITGEA